jgi:hypothetical protein
MKHILLAAGLALAAVGDDGTASAETIGRYGKWQSFAEISTNGRPMCGAALNGSDQAFVIKYEVGSEALMIHLGKLSWRIPTGQRVAVVMQVDRAPAMTLYGYGRSFGGFHGIEMLIGASDVWSVTSKPELLEFISLIVAGSQVRFYFPDGDKPGWEGSLTGATEALNATTNCIRAVAGGSAPTQPYGRSQPTQPFTGPRVPAYQPL